MTDAIAAMKTLIQEINKHNHNYYTLDQPTISDAEWDALYDRLTALEKETGTILPSSPTQRVGADILKGFEPHRHLARLWSLDKAQNAEDLKTWHTRVLKLIADYNSKNPETPLPDPTYVVELKFDGLTLNLTYEAGQLKQASTRGNGTLSVIHELYKRIMGKLTKVIKIAVLYLDKWQVLSHGY